MEDVECPYCGYPQDINHDDGYGYEEDETFQQECPNCGMTFKYTTTISYDYEAEKCECFNGGEHKWKLSQTEPKCASEMECTECGETRALTEEEHKKYGIETRKQYFERIKNM